MVIVIKYLFKSVSINIYSVLWFVTDRHRHRLDRCLPEKGNPIIATKVNTKADEYSDDFRCHPIKYKYLRFLCRYLTNCIDSSNNIDTESFLYPLFDQQLVDERAEECLLPVQSFRKLGNSGVATTSAVTWKEDPPHKLDKAVQWP